MNNLPRHFVAHVPRRFTDRAWGGTERVIEQLLPCLGLQGFDSAIYTSQAKDHRSYGLVSGLPITRYPYFYAEWPLSEDRKQRYDNKGGNVVVPSLYQALVELEQLDLIHCHTGNLLGAFCLRAARQRDIPIVITLHGGHFAIPEDELEDLAVKRAEDPRGGFRWGRLLSLIMGTRELLRSVDAVICVGLDEFEAARAALPEQRVEFLPGGVNLDAFAKADCSRGRAELGVSSDRQLVVCIARLDRQKDQATLVRAWAQHCSSICDLALVGPETSPGYADELRDIGRQARGRLIVQGGVDPEMVPHIFAAGDLSVLPSRHEPFGLACLESWAAGTALVAADVGGPAWLVRDGEQGRLFRAGDVGALGRILVELLESPDQRHRLAEAGRKLAYREYGWEHCAARQAQIYRSVLNT